MSAKVVAAAVGLILTVGGVLVLGIGLVHMASGPAYSQCVGDGCLDDPWLIGLPAGIIAMVFGLIIGGWALGSLRQERGMTGPLSAFGFMSGLGGVFVVLGAFCLFAFNGVDGGGDGTFLFLGALFGIMGLAFLASDLLRFRGELKKDRLRATGLHGTARVLAVHDTNVTVNNSPMVSIDLEVTVPGQAPFRKKKRIVISRLSVGALYAGATIPVLADPAKPTDIVLDWEAVPDTDDVSSASGAASMAQALQALLGGSGGAFAGADAGAADGGSTGGGAIGGLAGAPAGLNAEVLRSVSQALSNAADRAEHGRVTRTAGGATVIDGGTTIMVNGRVVSGPGGGSVPGAGAASPAGGAAGLAGAIAAAAATSQSGAGSATQGLAGQAGAGSGAIDVPLPGAASGSGAAGSGLPARVSLDSIQDTGVDIAGNRLYAFDLTVSVAGRQPYQTKHAAVVPASQVPRLVRGASFPAEVDPSQPGQIAVHWDR